MKKKKKNLFDIFKSKLNEEDLNRLNQFFKDLKRHCLLNNSDNLKMKDDFKQAILYYHYEGLSLEKSLELLCLDNMGGFYARPAQSWFSLDDAAKIYPVSMEHGVMSVFRLAVNLKEKVVPELLQIALTFTIKRFPQFATTLKKGLFWHYLDSTKRCFEIKKEDDVPCQSMKVSQSRSQSFRVLYYKTRISIEFFHVLTDASGGMEFLKALISEYIRLVGIKIDNKGLIMDINENPSIEEFTNEFAHVEKSANASGLVNKVATQMTGELSSIKPCSIVNYKVDTEKLRSVAKSYGISVTTYILSIMFIACHSACEQYHGEFAIQVPVNMRKFYETKTLRNFSMYCGIRLPIEKIKTINDIKDEIREQLIVKSSKEEMHNMLYATKKLIKNIRLIPLVIKQPIAKFISGIVGDQAFTTTLSNVGIVELPPEYLEYLQDMEFTLNTSSVCRASCGLISYGNVSTLSITKLTKDPAFEKKIYELMKKDGLEIAAEGSEIYER